MSRSGTGFRVLVFRDGDAVLIPSRDEKSLNRYFPEMLDPLPKQQPSKCVLEGELVIANDGRLDFDALQRRIHPASLRVKFMASQTHPVSFSICTGKAQATFEVIPFANTAPTWD